MEGEIIVYVLIVAAFLAVAWIFTGRGEDKSLGHARDPRWKQLPGVFKLTWGFSTLFENSIGNSMSGLFAKRAESYRALAVAAALPLTAPRVFAAAFAMSLLCLIVAVALSFGVVIAFPDVRPGHLLLPVLILTAIGWLWPGQNLKNYTQIRQARMTRELPFAIDLIGAAMRAGLDFGAAMRYYVANAAPGPLVEEFAQVLNDTTLGRPFAESLNDMAARVRIESFTSFAGVVAYGAEIGAPIAKTLKTHGEDLRRERFHLAETKAAKAASLIVIPLIVFLMPAVFIIIFTPMSFRFGRIFIH